MVRQHCSAEGTCWQMPANTFNLKQTLNKKTEARDIRQAYQIANKYTIKETNEVLKLVCIKLHTHRNSGDEYFVAEITIIL